VRERVSGDQTTAAAAGKKVWQPKSSFDDAMAAQRSKDAPSSPGIFLGLFRENIGLF